MPYYVKITKQVRDAILPANISVTRTFDGNYLVYQSALSGVEGATLSDRAAKVGGALLTTLEAKQEINGEICKECHTPSEYADKAEEASIASAEKAQAKANGEEQTGAEQPDVTATQEVNIPKVEASAGMGGTESDNENKDQKESEVENE